ncbi:MAG: M24 family metallopeptidase [Xanthomonadales bacterium]|nr:M24 family metallopeptidase [Xanthomonadales bacterium]
MTEPGSTRQLRWLFMLLAGISLASAGVADGPDATPGFSQGREVSATPAVLPLRERPAVENRMLIDRLETLLPKLMRETGIDMWLVLAREYAEDPVYFTLVPQPAHAARRTTMLIFDLQDNGSVERLTVNRYPLGEPYTSAWAGGGLDDQWQALSDLIKERNPRRIGINVSRNWPVADGLTHALHQRLMEVLDDDQQRKLVPAEDLVVRWLESRSAMELAVYPQVVALARSVIAEAFSNAVITPGVTTTDDVAWFIVQRFSELELPIWFQPYVNYQRRGGQCTAEDPFCGDNGIIMPGDVLHTDVGICYLKLCTDTQEMGYVLRGGEADVPPGLVAALATGNRWQDLLTGEFKTGRSGNRIFERALQASREAGIQASIYTHPVGMFGHAPGPGMGMWDKQATLPILGARRLFPNTAYAIEGNIKQAVPEWDDLLVAIMLEQSAWFDGEKVIYLAGRQTRWHVIR